MIQEFSVLVAISAVTSLVLLIHRHKGALEKSSAEIEALRKQLDQDALQARTERNRLLNALGDAFLLVDAKSNIVFANEAAKTLVGSRELINRPLNEVFLDPNIASTIVRCITTGERVQSRITHCQQTSLRGDLEDRGFNAWVIDAAKVAKPFGEAAETRVIIRDVTAEHQVEQVRKDFVANASHELRTPLSIISGYLENLIDDRMVEDAPMATRFLTVMRKHADRISRIVEDMLMISRLESGEINLLKIEPFSFRIAIKDVTERLESVIRNQNARVTVTMPEPNLIVRADRFFWTQVLFNLIENALKQNPREGLCIEVGCEKKGNQILIWVTDNGVGIPSADLPHIFRRFYRVEKHHAQSDIKGTGLGLSIVKRAVEAHHGTIGVTSMPGIETKFMVTMPADLP
jgi:two-component system, OmpR family, phosphate regulon sensor histidine kinase PhoR